MIKIDNVSKQFEDKIVLNNISFNLGANEVVGLIGENGSGKTTLLKIIAGDLTLDQGKIEIQNEVIGYLPQNPVFTEKETVESFLSKNLGQNEEYKINLVLDRVGLKNLSPDLSVNDLSGGQKTRIGLASLLIHDPIPTTLLLDEPTNNLDIEGIDWLEKFIISFKGNILLVSHDRTLLDNLVDKIIELDKGSTKSYGGNYSFYREQKEIEQTALEKMYVAQQKRVAKTEEDIEKMQTRARQGEKQFGSGMPYQRRKIRKSAQQAVHRKKKLEKSLASEKRLEKPEEKTKYFISLSGETHPGKTLLQAKNISKSFSGKKVLDKVSFHIAGGEKIWLAGLNGSGKSTLLKIIINELKQDNGSIEIGNNVNIGYFSQDRQDLEEENKIIDELMKIGLNQTESYKLGIKFNFRESDLTKKIKDLSMGQKAKVAFAKLTSGNYQLLILDEPTNHLEIQTREILEDALNNYRGGILVASHDRFFLERIGINRIINLSPKLG